MTKITEAQKSNKKDIMEVLHPLVKEWFLNKFVDSCQGSKN